MCIDYSKTAQRKAHDKTFSTLWFTIDCENMVLECLQIRRCNSCAHGKQGWNEKFQKNDTEIVTELMSDYGDEFERYPS